MLTRAPMRLAIFSYGLPVQGQKRGGIERVAHAVAQGLADRHHDLVVFSHYEKPEGATYEVRALPWKPFVNTWLGRRVTMGYLGNVMALVPDYRGFDVLIALGDSLLLPLQRTPVLRVMLGSALGEAKTATSVGRFVLQSGVYLQELATALTQKTVGISENTCRFNPFVRDAIPLGVDSTIFRPAPDRKTEQPSIIFVGTAAGRKRGGLLLNIFQTLIRPAYPDAMLMFVGPAGEPMPGVSYHTGVSDAQLAALYQRAWLYVSPSSYEGFGLPYLEAMACGTAVVATPNPGSREVLQGGTYGRLVEDAEFAPAILDLLGNASSRHALEQSGLRRAQELSMDSMINRYETVLAQLSGAHVRSIASA
jgi:phosphatidylinositol alpha-mannosyltransferase